MPAPGASHEQREEVSMDNPRTEKVAVVDEVRERFDASSVALLTEYRGLDVAAIGALRQALRAAGRESKVYQNTLVRFAARDLGSALEARLTAPPAPALTTPLPPGTPGPAG